MNNAVGDTVATPQTITIDPEMRQRLETFRDTEAKREALRRQVWRERRFLLPILAVALAALPNFRVAEVQGHSMAPTFKPGDRLVLLKSYKYFSPLKTGDIVVIKLNHGRYKGEEWVKRIVFIQNAEGNAPWPKYLETGRGEVPADAWFPREVRGEMKVPPGKIYVLGDNIAEALDSRDPEIGAISDAEILGKVLNN